MPNQGNAVIWKRNSWITIRVKLNDSTLGNVANILRLASLSCYYNGQLLATVWSTTSYSITQRAIAQDQIDAAP